MCAKAVAQPTLLVPYHDFEWPRMAAVADVVVALHAAPDDIPVVDVGPRAPFAAGCGVAPVEVVASTVRSIRSDGHCFQRMAVSA